MRTENRAGPPPRRLSAEALFRAHAEFVAAFLSRLGVAQADVDDLVQEVFLVVHRKGGFELGPAQPRSWLAAIAVRVASTRRRSLARRREQLGDEAFEVMPGAPSGVPEAQLGARQSLARVQRALDMMDVEHRGVFVLYELEGESCASIAKAFEVPLGTVYSRLHTARRRFSEAHARLVDADGAARSGRPAGARDPVARPTARESSLAPLQSRWGGSR